MIIEKKYTLKFLSFFLISFIFLNLLTNGIEGNEINFSDKTANDIKYFHPIPIINRTLSKKNVKYFIIPRLKLGTCFLGKTGSIVTRMVLCYLKKKKNERNEKDFTNCKMDGKNYDNAENFEKIYGVKKFNKFFKNLNFLRFVRNPIDRLISGYMHLCYYGYTENDHYCFGCNKNFTCFVNMLEKRLWQIINNEPSPFKIGKELGYSYHFYPQTWHCDYYKNQHIYTYIKYDSSDKDSFTKNIAKALKKSNISNDTITFITKKIYEIRTQHVTISKNATTSYKNILYNNPLLLQKICSIYYYDFIKFGFDLPKECKN